MWSWLKCVWPCLNPFNPNWPNCPIRSCSCQAHNFLKEACMIENDLNLILDLDQYFFHQKVSFFFIKSFNIFLALTSIKKLKITKCFHFYLQMMKIQSWHFMGCLGTQFLVPYEWTGQSELLPSPLSHIFHPSPTSPLCMQLFIWEPARQKYVFENVKYVIQGNTSWLIELCYNESNTL